MVFGGVVGSEWWSTFSAHLAAIVLGGVKVILISWLLWFLFRKKFIKKFVVGMTKDLMGEILPTLRPPVTLGEAVDPGPAVRAFTPESVVGKPVEFCPHCDGTGIKDYKAVLQKVDGGPGGRTEDQRLP